MITFGAFVLGLLIFGIGFTMVWKTNRWREYVGSLSDILGYSQYSWLDWNLLGVIIMVIGVVVALGLFQTFIMLTLGRIFAPSL